MKAKKQAKKTYKKGSAYVCNLCGLEVTIKNPCDCGECAIACCGQVMKPKKK
ncbi:MAG: hypothetical protein KGZ86_04480 [Candidatus Latescibacteria bacterium]|nr:hypothetical protein [Candidatus Latescibacterota bacterium]